MATKTITLTGAEVAVTGLDGAHAHIRNDSTDTIYAAKMPGITAGADGVASIPAGQADTLRGISGRVYLLGTGSALIQSDDYVESPFKASTASGGSAVDEQARTALKAHENNAEIHVTADKKASWDGKAELTDIPTTLPANGGNADTLDGLHANEIASNPNLLINPDFRINQRGLSEYTSGYTADRWSLDANKASVSVGTDGVCITATNDITSNTHIFWQWLEFPLPPGKYTLSVNVKGEVTGLWNARIRTVTANGTFASSYYTPVLCTGVNKVSVDLTENEYISAVSVGVNKGTEAGNSVKLEWIKLEPGSGATTFLPPDYTTELSKCQRYYQIRSVGDIDPVDLRPSMATIKDIKQRSDGNYEYIAEL